MDDLTFNELMEELGKALIEQDRLLAEIEVIRVEAQRIPVSVVPTQATEP